MPRNVACYQLGLILRNDGVTIYSVGLDKTDNKGNTSWITREKGFDLGFRLWNPDQRGLPPIAKAKDDPQPK
jgi:hypothetical protein